MRNIFNWARRNSDTSSTTEKAKELPDSSLNLKKKSEIPEFFYDINGKLIDICVILKCDKETILNFPKNKYRDLLLLNNANASTEEMKNLNIVYNILRNYLDLYFLELEKLNVDNNKLLNTDEKIVELSEGKDNDSLEVLDFDNDEVYNSIQPVKKDNDSLEVLDFNDEKIFDSIKPQSFIKPVKPNYQNIVDNNLGKDSMEIPSTDKPILPQVDLIETDNKPSSFEFLSIGNDQFYKNQLKRAIEIEEKKLNVIYEKLFPNLIPLNRKIVECKHTYLSLQSRQHSVLNAQELSKEFGLCLIELKNLEKEKFVFLRYKKNEISKDADASKILLNIAVLKNCLNKSNNIVEDDQQTRAM